MAFADLVRVTRYRALSIEPGALIAFLLPGALVLLAVLPTGDLAYQIRAGQIMTSSHEILRRDVFTYTFAGRPWIDQQWGAQIVLWLLFRFSGWRGLVLARAVIVSLAVGLTYRRTRAAGSDPMAAGFLSLGCFLVVLLVPGTTVLRPQLFAVALFVLAAWVLQIRSEHPRGLLVLPLAGIAWANIHGSFVLLPILVLTAVIDDVLTGATTKRWTIAVLIACSLTPLMTPWGLRTYSYVVHLTSSHIIRTYVEEWQPLYEHLLTFFAFALVNVVIGYSLVRYRDRRPSAGESFGIATFTLLAIWSSRNVIWWALYAPPVYGALLAGSRREVTDTDRRTPLIEPIVVLSALLTLLAAGRVLSVDPQTALLSEAPVGLTDAVQQATAGGQRLFDGSWGSWFEFALPDAPVFLDARGEMAPDDVWQEYRLVMSAQPGWSDVLDRWNIGVVAIPFDGASPILRALESDRGWTVTYQDADGVVFRRTSVN
jgi:hypothetical protein